MVIEILESDVFVPEFNGNKKNPAEEQINIEWRFPDLRQKKRILPSPDMQFEYDADGKYEKTVGKMRQDTDALVKEMTCRILNLSYKKNGKETLIVNADQLLGSPAVFGPLVKEIADFYNEKLKELEVEVKN